MTAPAPMGRAALQVTTQAAMAAGLLRASARAGVASTYIAEELWEPADREAGTPLAIWRMAMLARDEATARLVGARVLSINERAALEEVLFVEACDLGARLLEAGWLPVRIPDGRP